MYNEPEETDSTSSDNPVLLVVDGDLRSCAQIEVALVRRFGKDYEVLTANGSTNGILVLQRLAQQGRSVALVAADLGLPDTGGIDFLERAHSLHQEACRVLLLTMDRRGTRIPLGELETLQRSTVLGQVDFSILKGWVSPEEWFYPQVQEALSAWTLANRPHHEVVRIVGESWDPRSYDLRSLLSRNTVPFGFYAASSDQGRQLMRDLELDDDRLPAAVLHDGSVLENATLVDIVDALGFHTHPSHDVHDLAIVGAGPAGLAASVYGASEGLSTIVIEPEAVGGQAGTSSLIRNYLGFPRGLSGGALSARAWEQALLFGAGFILMERAASMSLRGNQYEIALAGGNAAGARAVILAIGVEYRRLGIPSLERLTGAGVFYGATGVDAAAMTGQEVFVIGGANSAGEAALHLARFAAKVTLVVRGATLSAGMSDYLVTEIESTGNIDVRLQTEVVDGSGDHRLKTLVLERRATHDREEVETVAVFVLIGAQARTDWLPDEMQRDDRGFILTGVDVRRESWPLARAPLPYETSLPGVFAVGDVRHGSIKRVAGAVGEGSAAVASVHRYLADVGGGERQ